MARLLIGLTTTILAFLSIFSLILGSNYTFEVFYQRRQWGTTFSFDFNRIEGALVWLVGIITIFAVVGITILGSGLSEVSVRAIGLSIAFIVLWAMLSLLSFPLIIQIAYFGYLIWAFLTILYVIGVIQVLGGS